jgi:hypothetical protein
VVGITAFLRGSDMPTGLSRVDELYGGRIAAGRRMFDPVGHYARPDVLTLTVSEPEPRPDRPA